MKKLAISILLLGNNLFSQTTYTAVVVKDINIYGGAGIANVTKLNNKIIFSANDSINGNEPWVSDGSAVGTFMLKDINPGQTGMAPNSSGSANYLAQGSKVYFSANNSLGNGLWVTDGTTIGTTLVKQFASASPISKFASHLGKIYFMANDGVSGNELWVSDGTTGGTQIVKDINVGAGDSYPQYLCSHTDGYLYFMASDTTFNFELWKTDGTAAGTQLVKDIVPGPGGSYPTNMYSYNGLVYFAGYDFTNLQQLWVSDGTAAGTQLFKVINPSGHAYPTQFDTLAGNLIFLAENSSGNSEPWVTDGTPAGTTLIKDIDNNTSTSSGATNFYHIGNKLYFSAATTAYGRELWVTDGTNIGTQLVKDIYPGAGSSNPGAFYYNGSQFFMAGTLFSATSEMLLTNLATSTASVYCKINNSGSSNPSMFFELGIDLFAVAEGAYGNEIYRILPVSMIGIKEHELLETSSIYPNPAKNVLYASEKLHGQNYIIYNSCGEQVQIGEVSGVINIQNLLSGVYIFNVNGVSKKFIKE